MFSSDVKLYYFKRAVFNNNNNKLGDIQKHKKIRPIHRKKGQSIETISEEFQTWDLRHKDFI